jgi:hypothetical protein
MTITTVCAQNYGVWLTRSAVEYNLQNSQNPVLGKLKTSNSNSISNTFPSQREIHSAATLKDIINIAVLRDEVSDTCP